MQTPKSTPGTPSPKKRKGGRPRGNPADVRAFTIGVRVSPTEYEELKTKAAQMGMLPAKWLREAALSRRLPTPPVPQINREQYAELARLSANINQLAHAINSGKPITVSDSLLQKTAEECRRLRLSLLGLEKDAPE